MYHNEAERAAYNWQVRRLVENNVDPNMADLSRRTALHLAASNGHEETLQYLLAVPDINKSPVDMFEGTPLQDAIRHKHHNIQARARIAAPR